jgi:hypothetical protein
VDEQCYQKLWNEMLMRDRPPVDTRYAIAATATQGLGWTYQLYLKWKKFHEDRGVTDEREMMRRQLAPDMFVWPEGGHRDNPLATHKSWQGYLDKTERFNKMERHVRLYGGFREFAGEPVFDLDALEEMRGMLEQGESGWFMPAAG